MEYEDSSSSSSIAMSESTTPLPPPYYNPYATEEAYLKDIRKVKKKFCMTGCEVLIALPDEYGHAEDPLDECEAIARGNGAFFRGLYGFMEHLKKMNNMCYKAMGETYDEKYDYLRMNCVARIVSMKEGRKFHLNPSRMLRRLANGSEFKWFAENQLYLYDDKNGTYNRKRNRDLLHLCVYPKIVHHHDKWFELKCPDCPDDTYTDSHGEIYTSLKRLLEYCIRNQANRKIDLKEHRIAKSIAMIDTEEITKEKVLKKQKIWVGERFEAQAELEKLLEDSESGPDASDDNEENDESVEGKHDSNAEVQIRALNMSCGICPASKCTGRRVTEISARIANPCTFFRAV
jgi:hypothetical protein